jgi:hypothetical protein
MGFSEHKKTEGGPPEESKLLKNNKFLIIK